MDRPTLQPSIALAGYAESLADGQRVVVFGEASSSLAEQLLERGARLVHVYDGDATRAAEAAARNRSQNLWFAPLADGELALRERSFDLALVENLAAHADPAALLRRIRRTLTGRGASLIACPNPDVRLRLLSDTTSTNKTLDYYALYDAVAAQFPHVRMLGQMPFVGYALADFGTEREPEPTLDSGFVPGGAEEPEWFIALASEHPTRLDEFAIIQLPFRAAIGSTKTVVLEQQLRAAIAAERRSRERLAEIEARVSHAADPVRTRPLQQPQAADDSAELKRELERREAWIAGLEARATAADERADTTQTELDEERAQAAELRQRLESERARVTELERAAPAAASEQRANDQRASEQRASEQRANDQRASEQRIAELELRATQAEELAATLQQRVGELAQTDDEGSAREIAALEAQLAERGAELRRLERDLREAERVGRELVQEMGALEQLRQKLDALATLNAEREADLAAARWTIEALESRLEDAPGSSAATSGGSLQASPGPREPTPQGDLDVARAELQRQAVLMEQIRSPR